MASQTTDQSQIPGQVFDDFQTVGGHTSAAVRLQLQESIRRCYPDFHVTCVESHEYDFLGFAQDHAEAELLVHEDGSRVIYDSVRNYVKPSRLVESSTGKLKDEVCFGHYRYSWHDNEFILYKVKWTTTCWGKRESLYYVLCPKENTTLTNVHSSTTDELLLAVGKWTSVPHEEIYVFDQTYWQKSAELWQSIKDASWDDVILEPKMKQNLIEDVQGFFDSQGLYQQFSVPWKRGIIMHGVPGNGKTISIKALINYLSKRPDPIPALYVKSLENKCDGRQASVKTIFDHARKMAPCLLVFEDLDSLITTEVRSYFLNEVDGLESNDGILMIGSTNHLDSLDPAIAKRPSRFDRKYHFRVPGLTERTSYSTYWQHKLEKNPNIDFPVDVCPIIATLTEGFSFAYLKELFVMALLTVARGGKGLEDAAENGWDLVSNSSTPGEGVDGKDSDLGKSETDVADKKKEKKAKEAPAVEVPEHLKDNVLLRVIQQQVKVLLHEMDNTDEENNPLPVLSGNAAADAEVDACGSCKRPPPVGHVARMRVITG